MIGTLIGGMVLSSVVVFLFVFWIKMIIDCTKRDFQGENEKVVWFLVIVLLGFLGATIYYFAVKLDDKNIKKKR